MRIANEIESLNFEWPKIGGTSCVRFARTAGIAAACALAAAPMLAQNERTGVSRPDPVAITANPDSPDSAAPPETPAAKPSAAVPIAPAGSAPIVYGPYVPYHAPGTAAGGAAFDPDAHIVGDATAGQAERHALSAPAHGEADLDAGIVTYVPARPGEIPDGTLLRAKLREGLSSLTTRPGSAFSAELTEPVMRDGRVIVPAGAVLNGRVTWVRGGKRLGGAAAIHLEPQTVTLPDGAQYMLRARVIDTDRWDRTKVDSEGTILRKDRMKGTMEVVGLATGGGAAAGAMIGGVPGALIGAGVGAGVSTVVLLRQDRQAELPKDLGVVFSLTAPMRVTPARAAVVPADAPGGE